MMSLILIIAVEEKEKLSPSAMIEVSHEEQQRTLFVLHCNQQYLLMKFLLLKMSFQDVFPCLLFTNSIKITSLMLTFILNLNSQ